MTLLKYFTKQIAWFWTSNDFNEGKFQMMQSYGSVDLNDRITIPPIIPPIIPPVDTLTPENINSPINPDNSKCLFFVFLIKMQST